MFSMHNNLKCKKVTPLNITESVSIMKSLDVILGETGFKIDPKELELFLNPKKENLSDNKKIE